MEEAHHTQKRAKIGTWYLGRRKLKDSNNISSRAVGMSKNSVGVGGGSNYVVGIIFILIEIGGRGVGITPLAPQNPRP